MKLASKTRYGLRALVALARLPWGRAVQVRQLAEQEGIPARFLEQVFQDLRRAGLVTGRRGPGGGFRLNRPADAITMADVVLALEGPVRLAAPEPDGPQERARPVESVVREALREAAERVEKALAEPSLAELAHRAEELARLSHPPRRYTYVI